MKEERDRHILSLWTFFVGQIFKPFMDFFCETEVVIKKEENKFMEVGDHYYVDSTGLRTSFLFTEVESERDASARRCRFA